MSKEYPWGKGTPTWVRDATANDSDKSFTVPAGKVWVIKSVYHEELCTATVGTRLFWALITNGADVVYRSPGVSLTASQQGAGQYACGFSSYLTTIPTRTLSGATNNAQNTAFMPDFVMPAGYVVRVYDSATIDAAADDLTVVLHYVEYDA